MSGWSLHCLSIVAGRYPASVSLNECIAMSSCFMINSWSMSVTGVSLVFRFFFAVYSLFVAVFHNGMKGFVVLYPGDWYQSKCTLSPLVFVTLAMPNGHGLFSGIMIRLTTGQTVPI
jgi:hypothetical protein